MSKNQNMLIYCSARRLNGVPEYMESNQHSRDINSAISNCAVPRTLTLIIKRQAFYPFSIGIFLVILIKRYKEYKIKYAYCK